MGFPSGTSRKEPASQDQRHKRQGFNPWVGKIPWRRTWQPTPVFLPRESHGQKSPTGYGLQSHKELDMTECMHARTLHLQNYFSCKTETPYSLDNNAPLFSLPPVPGSHYSTFHLY